MIESLSITEGRPIILAPLSVIILVTMIKDLYEDHMRKKADSEENDRYTEKIIINDE